MSSGIEQDVGSAVLELLSDEGYDSVDADQVAARAELDVAEVARLYSDRRALLEVAIEHDEEIFQRAIGSLVEGRPPTEALVLAIGHTLLTYDWTPWLELWALALREDWILELSMGVDRDFQKIFQSAIEAGVEAGTMTSDDPHRDAVAICALIDMSALQTTLGDPSVPRQYLVASVVLFASHLLDADLDRDLVSKPAE